MGFEEAVDLLFKLNLGLLPSKQPYFQCLVSEEKCIRKGLDCKNCHYSIPNFYALSSLVESIENLLRNLKHSILNEEHEAEITRTLNRLYMQFDLLEEAQYKFGNEEVFKFFQGGKEGFFELLSSIDEVNMVVDIEKYITYRQVDVLGSC
ncbi:hypothetical protein AB4Z22_09585 [Paenibacillus sp. TAF58]